MSTHPLAPLAFLALGVVVLAVVWLTIGLKSKRSDAASGEWDRDCERERSDLL